MKTLPWQSLEQTLRNRRHLEQSLNPVEMLGIHASPKSWQNPESFQKELKEKRIARKKENKQLWKDNGLKNEKAVRDRIEELKQQEKILWSECRPDLYSK